ncbi:hypothetical protein RHSIM_Rhsim06G0215000 [Rhododendron simsii]|uniref:Uncharacterized protein n=1 Tax=Rhododendron simsii TaxID=118357 RepID=A0A834GVL9_RHOSS|nr:hypothetical protein RHSIM_Rhsim06G0215000 [Rhododendron simsii]
MMRMSSCLHCQSPFFPMLSHHKLNQQPNTAQLLWLTRNQPNRQMYNENSCMKTKAFPISTSLVLGVASPAKPDISVFLGTSAVLLFMYWISNFVVPELILKDLRSDQTSGDQKPDAENNLVDFENQSTSAGSKSSQTKKSRSFKSTKL